MNPRYTPRDDYAPKHSEHPNPAREHLDQATRDYLAQGGTIRTYGTTQGEEWRSWQEQEKRKARRLAPRESINDN